jgi:hypothetical protein
MNRSNEIESEPGNKSEMSEAQELAKKLRTWKQRFSSEVLSHYQADNAQRGRFAFDRWKIRFTDFLSQEIPQEATRFQKEMTYFGGLVTVYGESPYDEFMREDGKRCVAFIDDLTEAVLKGHILYPQPKNRQPTAKHRASEPHSPARGTIIAAVIAGFATIAAALILTFQHPDTPRPKFVGRVRDAINETPIRNAKVMLEIKDLPPVIYTDSEGVFSFPIAAQLTEVHIRVDAAGYEKFDRRIAPSLSSGVEDIRLQPQTK